VCLLAVSTCVCVCMCEHQVIWWEIYGTVGDLVYWLSSEDKSSSAEIVSFRSCLLDLTWRTVRKCVGICQFYWSFVLRKLVSGLDVWEIEGIQGEQHGNSGMRSNLVFFFEDTEIQPQRENYVSIPKLFFYSFNFPLFFGQTTWQQFYKRFVIFVLFVGSLFFNFNLPQMLLYKFSTLTLCILSFLCDKKFILLCLG